MKTRGPVFTPWGKMPEQQDWVGKRDIHERQYEPGDLDVLRKGFEPYTDQDQYALADSAGNVTYFCTASAAAGIILPSAGPSTGLIYRVVRTAGAATLSFQASSGTIDGAVSASVSAFQVVQSDGENWWTIGKG